jgi:hypothetical protein
MDFGAPTRVRPKDVVREHSQAPSHLLNAGLRLELDSDSIVNSGTLKSSKQRQGMMAV